MQAQREDVRQAPILVVGGVLDELIVAGEVHALAEIVFVIGLQNVLAVIVEPLLVAGFAIAARSMTSRCNNSICGDIDRGGQNSNCFVRIPTKPAMHSNMKPAAYSDLKPAGVPI